MKITAIREQSVSIRYSLRNAYINFSEMTVSVVAIIADVMRDGRPVVGYGFHSNGRYAPSKIIRGRFIPSLLNANPESLLADDGANFDPFCRPMAAWLAGYTRETPRPGRRAGQACARFPYSFELAGPFSLSVDVIVCSICLSKSLFPLRRSHFTDKSIG